MSRPPRAPVALSSTKAADPRRGALRRAGEVPDAILERAREALAAAGPVPDREALGRIVSALDGLHRDAEAARSRMVEAGRKLAAIQRDAGPGGYRALLRAGLVPFSEPIASRLRAVAEAVDTGRLPARLLPRALEAAAAVARLPEAEVRRLEGEGALRPEATVKQIREALRLPAPGSASSAADRQRLERRLAAISAAMARLEAEAEGIRARLAEGR